MKIHKTPKPIPLKIVITWSDGTTTAESFSDFCNFYATLRVYRALFYDQIDCKNGTITSYTAYVGTTAKEKDGKKI